MCSSDEPADGISSKIGTSDPRRNADLLLAFAPRGVADVLAALDPAGRHLDQIALAEREMRAKPELADQHDFVAIEIDRQDDHDAADPHGIALDRRAVQLHAIAFVAINAAAAIFGARELDLDRGIGEIGIAHRAAYCATAASGEASRLKAAANKARV